MSSDMIHLTRKKMPFAKLEVSSKPEYFGSMYSHTSAINLSSVLHEVYSYCNAKEEHLFWHLLNTLGYDYIIIRDLVWNDPGYLRASDKDVKAVYDRYSAQVADFERVWGSITLQKNLVHYLLKYRYRENWGREVHENYLGYSTDAIINNLSSNYSVMYRKDYILPFLYDTVKKDFGIELKNTTHTQLIFKRRDVK